MSMSDCEKCWDSLCTCGWEYRHWTPGKVEALIATLFEVLDRRRRGVPDPREEYDHPRPAMKPVDWGAVYRVTEEAMREHWMGGERVAAWDDLMKAGEAMAKRASKALSEETVEAFKRKR